MGKFTKSKLREERREASIKVDEFFQAHEEEIGGIYGKLVELRDRAAKKLGFSSFTELGYLSLGRVDYDAKMVEKYRAQIAEEVVPLTQKLYKSQAKRIGIPFKKMYSYDYNLSFLSGNPEPMCAIGIPLHFVSNRLRDESPFWILISIFSAYSLARSSGFPS